ncbi:hypothetical protein I4F81_007591 [Pyropia yezoensis]|uniref:Uncharacterized protein n=1 Tax=Pyropia yezoensis TaxID=2788 RepID=A0ACC3C5N2_PYRYE|nr:hypothetical protein I4F81_007591 [Neopyropia yezoensis]
MMAPLTARVHHVGLTVLDLSAATAFFLDVLGFSKAGADDLPLPLTSPLPWRHWYLGGGKTIDGATLPHHRNQL